MPFIVYIGYYTKFIAKLTVSNKLLKNYLNEGCKKFWNEKVENYLKSWINDFSTFSFQKSTYFTAFFFFKVSQIVFKILMP